MLTVSAKNIFKGVWQSLLLKNTEMPGTIVKMYFNNSTKTELKQKRKKQQQQQQPQTNKKQTNTK